MDTECPRISVRFYRLRLTSEILIAVLYVTLAKLWLKIGTELDAVGRIDVNHLYFAREIFAPGKACHYLERVTQNHSVRPVNGMLVELNGLMIGLLRIREQITLYVFPHSRPHDRLGT